MQTGKPFGGVRDDFIPASDYIDPAFAAIEAEHLWPFVWQMACREEELARPGDFVTYDILDESIIVLRANDGDIRAFYNVCPHRGRRLTKGCGHVTRFTCPYHGWRWNLDGSSHGIVDEKDWEGALAADDVALNQVRTGRWGGWVFVCMDPEAPALAEFLQPAKDYLDAYEFEKMRYKWRRQTILPANWKVALEAFSEAYHVQTTHRQLLQHYQDDTYSEAIGMHGMFGSAESGYPFLPSRRLGRPEPTDLRPLAAGFYADIKNTLDAMLTDGTIAAAQRVAEMPENTPPDEMLGALFTYMVEEEEKSGRGWPAITPEQMGKAGADWHIFPNMIFLQQPTSLLGYRARPMPGDPDKCIFDIYALERYAPGTEPRDVRVQTCDDLLSVEDWGLILVQDFGNMAAIQSGMKSRGFRGARPNPRQEKAVSNFHRALRRFMGLES
jgi:phenylpropionate dioxygenase-like ring-hydroxylating dioxygenase large terminal subunit